MKWTCSLKHVTFVAAGTLLGGASGLVHAQSSVTLYGLLDAGLTYTNKTFDPSTRKNSGSQLSMVDGNVGGSRFGLQGVEDLGGGIRAIFDLESGINMPTGGVGNSNGNFWGRQAWVGLTGGFGTVITGLQFSPFVLALIGTDPRGAAGFGSGGVTYIDNIWDTALFNQNSISYTSPVFGGFQGSAMVGLGGTAGDFQSGLQYSGSLKYQAGGLMVNAALYNSNAGGAPTPIPSTIAFTGRTIGAAYTINNLTVKASYVNYKVSGSFDSRIIEGGASYNITPSLDVDGGVWVTSDGNNTANHSILTAAGIKYSLSRRTTLYGQVGLVHNHGMMDTGLSINGALFEGPGTTVGTVVGVEHTF